LLLISLSFLFLLVILGGNPSNNVVGNYNPVPPTVNMQPYPPPTPVSNNATMVMTNSTSSSSNNNNLQKKRKADDNAEVLDRPSTTESSKSDNHPVSVTPIVPSILHASATSSSSSVSAVETKKFLLSSSLNEIYHEYHNILLLIYSGDDISEVSFCFFSLFDMICYFILE
jgi:hypothetical protein